MATSVIESQRAGQTVHNQLLNQLVEHLASAPRQHNSTHRERLRHAHEASYLMNRLADSAAGLVNSYDHLDREPEIEVLSGKGDEGQKMGEFYERLAGVKTRHKSSTNSAAPGPTEETFAGLYGSVAEEDGDFLDRMFTGEEALGRYFDMNGLHAQYNNLPGVTRVSYLQFLDNFDAFAGIPRQRKLAGDKYKSYLEAVLEYLKDYSSRAYPLEDPEEVEEYAFERFEKAWRAKEVTSWQTDNSKQGGNTQGEEIWCEACQKMYSKQTVYSAHLSSKKHVKAAELLKNGNGAKAASANGSAASTSSASKDKETERAHYLARLEAIISTLMRTTWLAPIRNDTKSNVERKAALTDKERMQELQDMEKREAEETKKAREEGSKRKKDAEELEVEEEKIYNPLKLPLGWDGKPIPFWLYKLHGLGVEYECEICSGAKYAGRKNFERHFQEARHSFGMKALGLPNTKHFHEITKIEDAIALAERLKAEGKQEIFRAEEMEELEDEEGNVYNKKVYNDLKAQGIL